MDASSSHYRLPSLGTMLQTTEHGRRPFSFSRMNARLNTNTAAMPPSPPRSESRASDINPNAPVFVPGSTYHITRTQPPRPATLARPVPDLMAQSRFRNLSTATNPYPNDPRPFRRAVAGPSGSPDFTSSRRRQGHLRTDTNPYPNDPRPFQRETAAPSTHTGYTRTRQSEARLSTDTNPYPHDPRPSYANITGPDGRTRNTRARQSSAHMSTDTNPYHGIPLRFDPAIIAELDRRVAEAQAQPRRR